MRDLVVVDCSFILSTILITEVNNIGIEISESLLYVPTLFYLECINVLHKTLKRQKISDEEHQTYLQVIHRLPIIIDSFCATGESVHIINNLSQRFELTSYDAAYLELALRLGARLASNDKKLISACEKNAIEVITGNI